MSLSLSSASPSFLYLLAASGSSSDLSSKSHRVSSARRYKKDGEAEERLRDIKVKKTFEVTKLPYNTKFSQ